MAHIAIRHDRGQLIVVEEHLDPATSKWEDYKEIPMSLGAAVAFARALAEKITEAKCYVETEKHLLLEKLKADRLALDQKIEQLEQVEPTP